MLIGEAQFESWGKASVLPVLGFVIEVLLKKRATEVGHTLIIQYLLESSTSQWLGLSRCGGTTCG